MYIEANNLYGHTMSQPLPYDEIKFDRSVKVEDIINTPDDSGIGYFVEIDLKYPDEIKESFFHFVLRINIVIQIDLVFI